MLSFWELHVDVLQIQGEVNFEKKGYWLRVGSSAMHLGLILFILDLFFYKNQTLHLPLFWVTTVATTGGMIACFYSQSIASLVQRIRG